MIIGEQFEKYIFYGSNKGVRQYEDLHSNLLLLSVGKIAVLVWGVVYE